MSKLREYLIMFLLKGVDYVPFLGSKANRDIRFGVTGFPK